MSKQTDKRAIAVTSHVGRDLLASAAMFKTEASVVWEYVVNSLQYVERGVAPAVFVEVDSKSRLITISDNGRGMTSEDLRHYFTMHGENRDRKAGRPGRGKFGTGKAAAFGIGKKLRISTIKGNTLNEVELSRASIDSSDGSEVPISWIVRDRTASLPNGTTVTVSDIVLPRIELRPIIEYIERHLAAFRASNPRVAVNDHICEYREPQISRQLTFRPSETQAKVIGDIELLVKVSQTPLPVSELGIQITAGSGNLVAVETAGIEKKEFGNYLFGEIDCIALELSSSPLEAYDMTRSLQLNPKHPVVSVLVGFIGSKLEIVRSQLAEEYKKARQSEQARKLAEESSKIADVLNADFRDQERKLSEIRMGATPQTPITKVSGRVSHSAEEASEWIEGDTEAGTLDDFKTAGRKGTNSGSEFAGTKRSGTKDELSCVRQNWLQKLIV